MLQLKLTELERLRELVESLYLLLDTRSDPYFIINALNLIRQERYVTSYERRTSRPE